MKTAAQKNGVDVKHPQDIWHLTEADWKFVFKPKILKSDEAKANLICWHFRLCSQCQNEYERRKAEREHLLKSVPPDLNADDPIARSVKNYRPVLRFTHSNGTVSIFWFDKNQWTIVCRVPNLKLCFTAHHTDWRRAIVELQLRMNAHPPGDIHDIWVEWVSEYIANLQGKTTANAHVFLELEQIFPSTP